MMDLAAPHVGFVLTSYAVTAVVILGLFARVVLTGRKLKQALKDAGLHDIGAKDGA